MKKFDLHIHTKYSDGSGSPKDIIYNARKKGLNGIAITDHNTLEGYFRAKDIDANITILPGFEVSTEAGHILVLGLEYLPKNMKCLKVWQKVYPCREWALPRISLKLSCSSLAVFRTGLPASRYLPAGECQ